MNMLRRWWVWLVVVLLVAGAGFGLNTWLSTNNEPDFKTTRIERGTITAAVAATGTLNPVVSVQVGSQVSGQLREIFVDFNSEVKQGEVIARIDPETFEYKVRQSQADVDAALSQVMTQQANIAAQQAAVSMAEVNLAEAKRDMERKQQLVEKGFISTAERDKAQAIYNALVEQVKTVKAQAGVAIANARNAQAIVKQREAALAQARVDLERTAIKAPVNGIVIKRSVEKGQTVAASLQAPELFIIAENLTDMRVDASIDESEIGRVRLGQKSSFTVDAFPGRNFEGVVKQIRKAAQNVSNVVTYTVVISASNPDKELLPGMTANVRIVTDSRDDVLKVANAALRYKPGGAQVQRTRASATQADSSNGTNGANGKHGHGGGMRAMRERLEKELQLSDSQKAKLDSIYTGMRTKMAASRDAPEADRQKLVERSRSETRAQITAMLTPEQNVKYEEILAESGDRGGARMRRGSIYTLDENKQPKLLEVRFGLTDGTSTEVISPEVREGMEIITGSTQTPQGRTTQRPPGPRMF
jgi:HlyD family secretion protein